MSISWPPFLRPPHFPSWHLPPDMHSLQISLCKISRWKSVYRGAKAGWNMNHLSFSVVILYGSINIHERAHSGPAMHRLGSHLTCLNNAPTQEDLSSWLSKASFVLHELRYNLSFWWHSTRERRKRCDSNLREKPIERCFTTCATWKTQAVMRLVIGENDVTAAPCLKARAGIAL